MYGYVAAGFDAETDYILLAGIDKALYFIGRQCQRVTHLHTRRSIVLEIGRCCTACVEFGGSVEGDICFACVEKHLHVFAVDVAAFALFVGSVRTSFAYAFVDFNAEPGERFVDIILGSRHKAL